MDPETEQREVDSVAMGGGMVAGTVAGAAAGTLVGGPVGTVVGAVAARALCCTPMAPWPCALFTPRVS